MTSEERARFDTLRDRVRERLREAKAARDAQPSVTPPPRYDDVFFKGIAWLDRMARSENE